MEHVREKKNLSLPSDFKEQYSKSESSRATSTRKSGKRWTKTFVSKWPKNKCYRKSVLSIQWLGKYGSHEPFIGATRGLTVVNYGEDLGNAFIYEWTMVENRVRDENAKKKKRGKGSRCTVGLLCWLLHIQ